MIDINKIYTSNNCGDFKITKYVNSVEVHVEFLITGYKTATKAGNVERGTVKDKLSPKLYGVGFVGVGPYKWGRKGKYGKIYAAWNNMLKRCHCPKKKEHSPAYIGVTVCKEWHNFQNFAKWFEDNYIEGFHLDKDIKFAGNKVYYPGACTFVSQRENNIQARAGTYTMKDPSNKEHEIYNMSEFCRGKDLCRMAMGKVYRCEYSHHKGWTKA